MARYPANRVRQKALELGPLHHTGREPILVVTQIFEQALPFRAVGCVFQATYVESLHLDQPAVILLQIQAHFGGDLFFAGRAAQSLFRPRDGGFDLLCFLSPLARSPIQPAQAVEYSSADAVLGVSFQLYVMAGSY